MLPRILLVSLLLLGCLALLFVLKKSEQSAADAARAAPPALTGHSAESVWCIHIYRQGKDEIEILRHHGQWWITRPIQARARKERIQSILSLLQTPSFTTFSPEEYGLEEFALVSPRVRLQLNDQTFHFGGTESIYARRYVLYAGRIHLTEDYLHPQLRQSATFFALPPAGDDTDETAVGAESPPSALSAPCVRAAH